MSDYGLGGRLRALLGILHRTAQTRLKIADVLDMVPQWYPGEDATAARKVRRDIHFLEEIGFIVERHRAGYWIVGYMFPDAPAKRCSKCRRSLPLDRFAPTLRGQYGRHSTCRSCINRYQMERRAANSPEVIAARREKKRDYQARYFTARYRRDPGFRAAHLARNARYRRGKAQQ